MPPVRICVLVAERSTALVPVGLAEMLRKSMLLSAGPSARQLAIELVACGASRKVVTAGGLVVNCDRTVDEVRRCDVAIASALDPDIVENLERNARAVPWLRRMYLGGADVMSVCTGAFFLAEAGLLDRRRATTHWAFADLLARRYPRVRVEPQAILVDEGRICTAGGATSFTSLALRLVERFRGADVSRVAASMFLVEPNKAPQQSFAGFVARRDHGDEEILAAQDLIEHDPRSVRSVPRLAHSVALTERTFSRRFKSATGLTPLQYVQRAQVASAKAALERTRQPFKRIAADHGYDDVIAFRKVFKRLAGLTPAAYRQRHSRLSPPALHPSSLVVMPSRRSMR